MKPYRPYFFKSSFVCFLMTRFLRNGKFRLPDKAAGFIPNLKKLESWQLVRWIVKRYVGKIVFLLFILVGRWLMILLRQTDRKSMVFPIHSTIDTFLSFRAISSFYLQKKTSRLYHHYHRRINLLFSYRFRLSVNTHLLFTHVFSNALLTNENVWNMKSGTVFSFDKSEYCVQFRFIE